MSLVQFIVLALATWRVVNFIYDDSQAGPYNLLHWLRHRIGIRYDDMSRRGVDADLPRWRIEIATMHLCPYCMSFWYGLFAVIIWLAVPYKELVFYMALPFALSATTIIVQKMVGRPIG